MAFRNSFLCLFSGALVVAASAAYAQENMIKIIQEDGSVAEYEIPENAVNAPVSPTIVKPAKQPPVDDGLRQNSSQQRIIKAKPQEAAPPTKEAEKAKESKGDTIRSESKILEKAPVKKVAKKKVVRNPWPPIPGRKPLLPVQLQQAAKSLPPETAIPKNLAIAVAIENAPPAKDFRVLRRMHEGLPVYAVVFKTEDGPYTVLIDAKTGDVVDKKQQ